MYLEVIVYNASMESVSGVVTIMRAMNLLDNQEVIKIASGKAKTVLFPKKDGNRIVTWNEIKLHDFSVNR